MSSPPSPADPPPDRPPVRAPDGSSLRHGERRAPDSGPEHTDASAEPRHAGVILYASWRGLLSAVATPAGFVLIGVLASGRFGVSAFTVGLTVVGVALAVALLVDFPQATSFDRDGITRHCIARRHRIGWDAVACLDRTPPRTASVLRNMGAKSRDAEREVSGGLVARGVRRRRWLLVDRVESRDEHDAVRALVGSVAQDVEVFAARPHAWAKPTWRHRRRAATS